MALSIAFNIGKAIFVGGRVVTCFLDVLEVTEDKEMSKKQKIFRIVTDALSILTQTVALGGGMARVAPNTQFALDGAAAVADLSQRVSLLSGKDGPIGLGDYLDLGSGVLLRVSSLVNDALVFKPQFFDAHEQAVETATNLATIVGTVVGNRDLPQGVWDCVGRLVKRLRGQPLAVVAPDQGRGRPYIVLAPVNADAIYRMKDMRTINELEEIPSLYRYDDVLSQFRCALSGNPIRHMLVVAGTETSAHSIWFEARAILQQIQEGEVPAQWPAGIAFTRENLLEFPAMQRQIDTELNALLDDIHNADLRFEPLERLAHPEAQKYLQMVAIIKAIGLERLNAMQDEEICDTVVKRVSPYTISDVCVDTILHTFHAAGQPKLAKMIRLTPTVTFLEKPPLSEEGLFAAARAALLSRDPRDKKALLLAQIPFEIRISTDLQDVAISSDLAKSIFERKSELLDMMKRVLQLEHLQGLSDEDLAGRLVARISRKPIVNVSVRSLPYQFDGTSAPQPAKAILFTPPVRKTGGRSSSADSLFAAARSVFGSQSKIDKHELEKRRTFIVYVDMNFQNIDIKEIS